MSDIWFSSDCHFGHRKIIEHCSRPFVSIEEMDEKIIENWNKVINNQDIIYYLGDFSFSKTIEQITKYSHILNGKIIYILGNHDKVIIKNINYFKNVFVEIYDYLEIEINNKKICMFHYPIFEWNGYFKNSYHFYGHIHEKENLCLNTKYNVGVDANNFSPISFEEINLKLKNIENKKLY